jgi:LPXTG-motif cell wall-anchored protein
VTFKDTFDDGLQLDGNIVVQLAEVESTLEGVKVKANTTPTTVAITNTGVNNNIEFKITPTNKAVNVKYTTKITREPDVEKETFKNSFTVENTSDGSKVGEAEKTVEVTYGTPLAKEKIGGDKYVAKWLVEFNKIGKRLAAGTTITDTISQGDHQHAMDTLELQKFEFVNGVLSSTPVKLVQDEDYEIDVAANQQEFTIKLLKEGTYALEITYDTKTTEEFVTKAGAVNNTVTTSLSNKSNQRYTISTQFMYPQGIGSKRISNIDYKNKQLEWIVTVGTDGKPMSDLIISDEFTAGLTLIPYSDGAYFKINRSGSMADIAEVNINQDKKGFNLEFTSVFTGTLTFTYKTSWEVLEQYGEAHQAYQNDINFSWDGVVETGHEWNKEVIFVPAEDYKNNAQKTGSYNYKDRVFNWTATINLDRTKIEKGTQIIDTIQTGHEFVTNSLKIVEAEINEAGKVTAIDNYDSSSDFNVATSSNGFTLTYNEDVASEKIYQITYQTKDSDKIIGQSTGAANEYKNVIEMKKGTTSLGKAEGIVKIDRANELLKKTAKQEVDASVAEWTIEVNMSGSNLDEVTVTDTPYTDSLVEHWILTNTVEFYPVIFNATGYTLGEKVAYTAAVNEGIIKADSTLSKENFQFNFGNLNGQAYIVKYNTYYDGPDRLNGKFNNKAELKYTVNGSENTTPPSQLAGEETAYKHNDSSAYANFKRTNIQIQKNSGNKYNSQLDKKGLAGAQFELWNKSGKVKIKDVVTTDSTGIATFTNVGYGEYIVREIVAPNGYQAQQNDYLIKVNNGDTSSNTLFKVTISNDEIVQSVQLTKTWSANKTQQNASVKFELWNTDTNTKVTATPKTAKIENGVRTLVTDEASPYFNKDDQTYTPDANGKVYVPYLEPGNYAFKEVQTAVGYQLVTTPLNFKIESGATTAKTVKLENKPLNLIIKNVEQGSTEGIPNSEFILYKVTSCPILDADGKVDVTNLSPVQIDGTEKVYTTNAKGEISIDYSLLEAGTYIVVQQKANEHFVTIQDTPVMIGTNQPCFTVNQTTEEVPTNVTFENVRETPTIALTLKKTEVNTSKLLDGAIFKLQGSLNNNSVANTYFGKTVNGEIKQWYTTKELTTAATPEADIYIVTEEQYPTGYTGLALKGKTKENNQWEFDYTSKATLIEATNEKLMANITIQNSCGQQASTYEVWVKQNGTYVKVQTDVDGNLINPITVNPTVGTTTINLHLPAGEYKIVQITGDSENCEVVDGNPNGPDFTITPDKSVTKTIDETDKPIYAIDFSFLKCEGPVQTGTYTITGTDGDGKDRTYTINVVDGVGTVVGVNQNKVLTGEYKVEGNQIKGNTTIKITATTTTITIETEDCYQPKISITACDLLTSSLDGQTYTITKQNDPTKKVLEQGVVANNEINDLKRLANGQYDLTIDGTTYTITVNGQTAISIATTDCLDITLTFKACDQVASTVEFDVTGPNGYKKTVQTNNAQLKNLTPGTYTVSTPNGTVVDTFIVQAGQTTVDIKTTNCYPVELVLKACNLIASTVNYTVTGPNQYEKIITQGKSTLSNLAPGTYEISNADRTFVKTFVVDENTTTVEFQTTNCYPLDILFKACTQNATNVNYKVTGPNGYTQTITSVVNGMANLTNLAPGTYTIQSADGKVTETIQITNGTQSITIQTTDCYVVDVTFKVCDKDASTVNYEVAGPNNFVETVTSITGGTVTLTDLAPGTYTVTDPNSNGKVVGTFTVANGQTSFTIQTSVNCYTAEINFKNCTQNAVTVDYTVTDANGAVIQQITSLTNGKATITDLAPGTYTVTKSGTTVKQTVTVTAGQTGASTLTIVDIPCPAPSCTQDRTVTIGTTTSTVTVGTVTVTPNNGVIELPMSVFPTGAYDVKDGGKVIGTVVVNPDCSVTYTPVPVKPSVEVEVEFKEPNSCLLYDERDFAIYYYTESIGGKGIDWYNIHTFTTDQYTNFVFELKPGKYYVIDVTDGALANELTEAQLKAAKVPTSFTVAETDKAKTVDLPAADCRSSFTFKFMSAFAGTVIVEKPDGTTETITVPEGETPTYSPSIPGDYIFCQVLADGTKGECVTVNVPDPSNPKTSTVVPEEDLAYRTSVPSTESTPEVTPTPNPGANTTPGGTTPSKPAPTKPTLKVPNLDVLANTTDKQKMNEILRELEEFIKQYEALTPTERLAMGEIDIDEIQQTIAQLRAQLAETATLPQTDAASNTMASMLGLLFVGLAFITMRMRRKIA